MLKKKAERQGFIWCRPDGYVLNQVLYICLNNLCGY